MSKPCLAHAPVRAAFLLAAISLSPLLQANPTQVSGGNAEATAGTADTTIRFPVTRSGDTGYDAYVSYKTQNGSAVAGSDFIATTGVAKIPAGTTSASIPVTVLGSATGGDKTFQLRLLSAYGAAGTSSWAAQKTFTTVALGAPAGVAAADINNDGRVDLVTANNGSGNISVLLNAMASGASTAAYSAPQAFATGSAPSAIAAADFNGDGRSDLVVTNSSANTVSVLLNATTVNATSASFRAQRSFATGGNPQAVAIADVNADGRPDVIVANAADNSVSVLLGTTAPGSTTASLANQQVFPAGSMPQGIAAADVNGDGRPDLIVSNGSAGTVSVLLNGTNPGTPGSYFTMPTAFTVGTTPRAVIASDLDGDGRADLAVANAGSNNVSVLLNATAAGASTPSFGMQMAFAAGSGTQAVAAVDVNGDARPDLVTANANSNNSSILINTMGPGAPAPSFAAAQAAATGSAPQAVAVADANRDGKADLLVANRSGNSASVLLNTTPAPTAALNAGSFSGAMETAADARNFATLDMNGDGRTDIVTFAFNGPMQVALNTTAAGAAKPSFAPDQELEPGDRPSRSAIADFNADGRQDIALATHLQSNEATNEFSHITLLVNATGIGSSVAAIIPPQEVRTGLNSFTKDVAAADINGDGKPDLMYGDLGINSNPNFGVRLNTTAPGQNNVAFSAPMTYALGSGIERVVAADINGDGRPDAVTLSLGDVGIMLNTTAPGASTASLSGVQRLALAPSSYADGLVVGDINLDGRPDILVGGTFGLMNVLINTTVPGASSISFAGTQTFRVSDAAGSPALADLNGDGRLDVVLGAKVPDTMDDYLAILPNTTMPGSSTVSFGTPVAVTTDVFFNSSSPIAVVDLNGDRRPELLASNGFAIVHTNQQYQGSVTASGTGTIHAVPATPSGVSATPKDKQVTLRWNPAAGASSYQVLKGLVAGGESATPAVTTSGTTATVTGLANGTRYYFKIKAVNAVGASAASAEVSAVPLPPPATPTALTVTATSSYKVSLQWAASARATSYKVFAGTSPGQQGTTPVLNTTGTSGTVNGLTNGKTYYFVVKGVNTAGLSSASNEVSATPQGPPAVPAGVSISRGNGQLTISWQASEGATSYSVLQGTASGQEGATPVKTTSGTSAIITGLTNGVTYYFQVTSSSAGGTSARSAEVSAAPLAPPLAPSNLSATPHNEYVTLSWSPVSGAEYCYAYMGATPGETSSLEAISSGNSANVYGLDNGVTYYFVVQCRNSSGYGPKSAEVSATPAP